MFLIESKTYLLHFSTLLLTSGSTDFHRTSANELSFNSTTCPQAFSKYLRMSYASLCDSNEKSCEIPKYYNSIQNCKDQRVCKTYPPY